jgi:hypothetical protein
MILNVYPRAKKFSQPVPNFVINFYEDLRSFILGEEHKCLDLNESIAELLILRGLSASISLNMITVNDWEEDNESDYMILCWQNIFDQHAFIQYYNAKDDPKPTPQPYASYRH